MMNLFSKFDTSNLLLMLYFKLLTILNFMKMLMYYKMMYMKMKLLYNKFMYIMFNIKFILLILLFMLILIKYLMILPLEFFNEFKFKSLMFLMSKLIW